MGRKVVSGRDRKILEMIRELLQAEIAFQEICKKHKKGRLQFSDIEHWVDDRGQSLLYQLKEQCHTVFRYEGTSPLHKKEWLLDLAIGSIFHEAMKLRENIYQIDVYRPRYLEYKLEAGETPYEKDYLTQFEKIISKAEEGVAEGMEETQSLFQDAKAQLIDFFKTSAENPFLARFLLEHWHLLKKVYGQKGLEKIFRQLYENGLSDAHRVAGQSYLNSEHYNLSSFHFSKALKLDPHDHETRFLLDYSLGMDAYYRNDYSRAAQHFSKWAALRSKGRLKREYLKKAAEACHKMANELKEEKRRKTATRVRSIAEQIKGMLQ